MCVCVCCWAVQYVVRWAVCCWAVQYVVTVACVLLGSAVRCYGGLCVVGQCSTLLRWAVCCWAVQYVSTVGLSDGKKLGYRDVSQLKSQNTKYENVKTSTDLFEAHVTF